MNGNLERRSSCVFLLEAEAGRSVDVRPQKNVLGCSVAVSCPGLGLETSDQAFIRRLKNLKKSRKN